MRQELRNSTKERSSWLICDAKQNKVSKQSRKDNRKATWRERDVTWTCHRYLELDSLVVIWLIGPERPRIPFHSVTVQYITCHHSFKLLLSGPEASKWILRRGQQLVYSEPAIAIAIAIEHMLTTTETAKFSASIHNIYRETNFE